MKFNPLTKELFTNNGQLIKKLLCPYNASWDLVDNEKRCSICEHTIVDTANFEDKTLAQLMTTKPDTCLSIDLTQDNLTIVSNGRYI